MMSMKYIAQCLEEYSYEILKKSCLLGLHYRNFAHRIVVLYTEFWAFLIFSTISNLGTTFIHPCIHLVIIHQHLICAEHFSGHDLYNERRCVVHGIMICAVFSGGNTAHCMRGRREGGKGVCSVVTLVLRKRNNSESLWQIKSLRIIKFQAETSQNIQEIKRSLVRPELRRMG